MKTIIATAVTVLGLFAIQSTATAGDYWHGGGHRASHVRHHWHGGGYHTPQYSYGYAPRYSQYSSGYGDFGYRRGYRGYGGGYRHGAYSGRRRGGHHGYHGHSAVHFDIGPLHFGLGR